MGTDPVQVQSGRVAKRISASSLSSLFFVVGFFNSSFSLAALRGPGQDVPVRCLVVQLDLNTSLDNLQSTFKKWGGWFKLPVDWTNGWAPLFGEFNDNKILTDEQRRYFYLPLQNSVPYRRLSKALELLAGFPGVRSVTAEPRPILAGNNSTSSTPNLVQFQKYLLDANVVDARKQFDIARGDKVTVTDIEFGWFLAHEDLPKICGAGMVSGDSSDQQHGTAVMGIIGALDNGKGITGIADKAHLRYEAISQEGGVFRDECLSRVIARAIGRAQPGDVVLLEVQMPPENGETPADCCEELQCGLVPAEAWDGVRTAIDVAVANNVIIVEPAGNGSVDLDQIARFSSPLRRSGAMLIAASQSSGGKLTCFSNHGAAIDFEAAGEGVFTAGIGSSSFGDPKDPRFFYTEDFGGTSSAAAIIAGVVADLQSGAQVICGHRLRPAEMLSLLKQTGKAGGAYIQVDLLCALKNLKNIICPGGLPLVDCPQGSM
jgi:subtilase family protein